MGVTSSLESRKYFAPLEPLRRDTDHGSNIASPYFVLVIRPAASLVLLYSDTQIQSIIRRRLRVERKPSIANAINTFGGKLMNDNTFEFSFDLTYDYALNGTQFKNAQIFCRLLGDLHTHGWKLVVSSDLCRIDPRSTLFFRRYNRDLIDAGSTFIGVYPDHSDRIRLIDMPDQLSGSLTSCLESWPSVASNVRIVCQEIGQRSAGGIEGSARRFIEIINTNEIDMKLLKTKIFLKIFLHLHENGFDFYGTVNMDGNADMMLFEKAANATRRPAQDIFAIDLVGTNVLRVTNGPSSLRRVMMNAINQHWPHGMTNATSHEPDCHIYKLIGEPWSSGSAAPGVTGRDNDQLEEALKTRKFLSALFEILQEHGWKLKAAVQLDRAHGGTSTFIFGPATSAQILATIHRNAWVLALMSTSSIYLINAFSLYRGSFLALKDGLKNILINRWPRGMRLGGEQYGFRNYELVGHPWNALSMKSLDNNLLSCFRRRNDDHGPNEDLHARGLLCAILAIMESCGHNLVCSAAITNKIHTGTNEIAQHKSDCDAWFWVEDSAAVARRTLWEGSTLTRSILGPPRDPVLPAWDGSHAQASQSTRPVPTAPTVPTAPHEASTSTQATSADEDQSNVEETPPPYPVEAPPPPYWKVRSSYRKMTYR